MEMKKYIKASGRTQHSWAQELGIRDTHMSLILNGYETPSLKLAARIERLTMGAVMAATWVKDD